MGGVVYAANVVVLLVQLSSNHLVPFFHFLVWSVREDVLGDVFGKGATIGHWNIPSLHRPLNKTDILLGTKKDLYRLPTGKPRRS